ncbi:hypothetical protein OUZ56_021977 [Daphnia magna]|uniref:Uncharacterized protein n=1 Tax=Daphnia magna TaxID=35525 RepID=A0ABR0AUZ9_9CRUS|nr:hypothetical protein OUZ56_021977 [Daphnia magna]
MEVAKNRRGAFSLIGGYDKIKVECALPMPAPSLVVFSSCTVLSIQYVNMVEREFDERLQLAAKDAYAKAFHLGSYERDGRDVKESMLPILL